MVMTPLSVPSEADRRATDSNRPLPSAMSLRPGPLGELPVDAPPTKRPRVSLRPASPLTGYDLPMDRESLKVGVAGHVEYTQGKDEFTATPLDYYSAAARATRDRLFDRWNKTQQGYYRNNKRRVYYLSLEYLLGRMFEDALLNLGIHGAMQGALSDLGVDLAELVGCEPDAGLGNGGLGRLAACFLDSMATLGVAAMGYGIRYEYGIFEQQIVGGKQVERADNWLRYGSPWEVPRPETRYLVKFGGRVEERADAAGRLVFDWSGAEHVWAMAHDYLVPGFGNDTVNTLRLWAATATRGFSFDYFNDGDYIRAVEDKNSSENISRVLYPNDMVEQGRVLRLKQEYFFVAATLQDAIARHKKNHVSLATFPEAAVLQLNDTHPGIAVAEFMRLLIDEYGFVWDEAWSITTRSIAYTNHTVLPEALETWPVSLLASLLPRHLQIIYEINNRFLADVRARFPGDQDRVVRMSLFGEQPEKHLRMAHLCLVGAFSVNGVSELHGQILRDRLFRDFAELWPQKFLAVTNGITPRRWLQKCNPSLSELITARLGEKWTVDLHQLRRLAPLAAEPEFRAQFRQVKLQNKQRLAAVLSELYKVDFDPMSLLSVQVKRIHEYKRQLLNILHVASLYLSYRTAAPRHAIKRTFLFSGKAAPGYAAAKLIIGLIVAVARAIDDDPKVQPWLKVIFVPNYGVSLAELIIPAADVSEQLSLAGTEASGTGNMKLALNGALTLGTADGANLEILEAVGSRNVFQFGLSASEVEGVCQRGYRPEQIYATSMEIRTTLDAIADGRFSPEEPKRFQPLVDALRGRDRFLVLADFESYRICHQSVLDVWLDPEEWTRRSIMNTCNMGRFSSDEVIRTYCRDIWKVET
jgi:glycogen phosphorylase